MTSTGTVDDDSSGPDADDVPPSNLDGHVAVVVGSSPPALHKHPMPDGTTLEHKHGGPDKAHKHPGVMPMHMNMAEDDEMDCPDCDGTGMIGDESCPTCGGSGKVGDVTDESDDTSDFSHRPRNVRSMTTVHRHPMPDGQSIAHEHPSQSGHRHPGTMPMNMGELASHDPVTGKYLYPKGPVLDSPDQSRDGK